MLDAFVVYQLIEVMLLVEAALPLTQVPQGRLEEACVLTIRGLERFLNQFSSLLHFVHGVREDTQRFGSCPSKVRVPLPLKADAGDDRIPGGGSVVVRVLELDMEYVLRVNKPL